MNMQAQQYNPDGTLTYVGRKIVKARPMTRGAYNTYRGWSLPENEEATDPGYLVEYLVGGDSNHENHTGYISWSPADVFDQSYLEVGATEGILDWRQNVLAELAELEYRYVKLTDFLDKPKPPEVTDAQWDLMKSQAQAMRQYQTILILRLEEDEAEAA